MIRINSIPDLDWTEHAREEIAANPWLVARSEVAVRVDDALIAGLYYPVLCGPPWFWLAVTKGLRVRALFALVELLPPNCYTMVKQGWRVGDRFARFFGFTPQESEFYGYKVYWRA